MALVDDSDVLWDEVKRELFFLFFPELKLVLLLLLLAPLRSTVGLGVTAAVDPEGISLGLNDADLVVLLLDERDLSERPEARCGVEEDDEWAEGNCGDEDTCRACVVP